MRSSRLIERYIIGAILPYLLLSLLLLTAILFIQQAGRFGELIVAAHVPAQLIWELLLGLLPSVLVFTLPMAVLTGTLIGFSRMGSDSELVALRSAGVGTWNFLWPVLLLGALLTGAALYINLELAPQAVRSLRQTGIRATLYKLESPVEPRSFYTEFPGLVIYVRDGDKATGQWGRVFLHMETNDGSRRLVTARSGRIDTAGERSELVLQDVILITLPNNSDTNTQNSYITEKLDQWRQEVDTGRKALMESLKKDEAQPKLSEMGLSDLYKFASQHSGTEALEARTLIKKRLAQSLSPLVFAFLGASLGLRVRRGGRGMGILLSLLAMLTYYLLSLAGEQMARTGTLPEPFGVWLATTAMLALGLAFLNITPGRSFIGKKIPSRPKREKPAPVSSHLSDLRTERERLLGFPSLMDVNVLRALALSFIVAFVALLSLFLIFTLFELWRFIALRGISMRTVAEYLIFLLPLATVQLLPASVLIAMLATYALIARRSEAIAWWASGQSVFRLMLPGLFFAAGLAAAMWFVQEQLMPQANVKQDILRTQIRGGSGVTRATVNLDKQWLASAETGRLYAYEFMDDKLVNLSVYEFDSERVHLRNTWAGKEGVWRSSDEIELQGVEMLDFKESGISGRSVPSAIVTRAEPPSVFKPTLDKPLHLSTDALSNHIKSIKKRGGRTTPLDVALQRKYAEPFSALVMALTGIPLALSFGRRSAVTALCIAIALGLLYWGATGSFRQMGDYELLPPAVAAWAPILIFTAIGSYLLARSRS